MKLADYLETEGLSEAQFASRIGVHEVSLRRYVSGERIPKEKIMRRIASETGKQVTANDFYGIRTN